MIYANSLLSRKKAEHLVAIFEALAAGNMAAAKLHRTEFRKLFPASVEAKAETGS